VGTNLRGSKLQASFELAYIDENMNAMKPLGGILATLAHKLGGPQPQVAKFWQRSAWKSTLTLVFGAAITRYVYDND